MRYLLILIGRPIFLAFYFCLVALKFIFSGVFRLRLPHFKFFITPILYILFISALICSFFYFWILKDLPSPTNLKTNPIKQTTQIYDRHGTLLYEIYDGENRTIVQLKDIPLTVRQATIAIEDKDFYAHQGFSLKGIFRAIKRNLTDHQLQGGSTITQQLIKNTLLSREKTLARKIKEVILSIQAELIYSKDEILQMYLNQVSYGGTAYGIQAGARQYFGKNVQELNLAEAALLAGLPQAPTKYSPFGENSKMAKERQLSVLKRLVEDGYLSLEEAQKTAKLPLEFISPSISIKAPHFVMFVKDILVSQFGEDQVSHGGLQIRTTLDLKLQEMAQTILNDQLKTLSAFHVTNAAILITKPSTGEILAMVGSRNYFDIEHDGQVNLTTALRQPGSAIKPINYALAFEKGFTPSSTIDDSPVTFYSPGSGAWSPKNYDGRFHGLVTLRTALGSSYNIPAVKLLAQNGLTQVLNLAQRMGLSSLQDSSRYGLSFTLGGVEVKMTDMAEVYGTLANLGRHIELTPFLDQNQTNSTAVISPQTAFLISDILSDNQARTPAFGANSVLNLLEAKVAVKTGTSNDLRDNWTIGFTPDFVVVVWVGNNDNSPMNRIASGITGASPIWAKVTRKMLETYPFQAFTTPDKITKITICQLTNTRSCPACPNPRTESYLVGSEPKTVCTEDQIKKIIDSKPTPTTDKILTGMTTSR